LPRMPPPQQVAKKKQLFTPSTAPQKQKPPRKGAAPPTRNEERGTWNEKVAGATRLELETSGVTGRRSNRLSYAPAVTTALSGTRFRHGGRNRTRTCDPQLVRLML